MMPFSRTISALPISLLAILVSAGLWGPPTAQAQHPTAVTSIVNSEQDTTLEVNHAGGLLMPGKFADPTNYTAPNDSIPAEGAGTRLLWYPAKAAFRAGRVGDLSSKSDVWDADSIGPYSVAFGRDTRASGEEAMAMGDRTTASGAAATALGLETTASGDEATAMGFNTTASGNLATAMGYYTRASGAYAMAMGFGTSASGAAATALGLGTSARGEDATAMGEGTITATDNSLSIGAYNSANSGSSGDGTLFVAGNGDNSNLPSSRSDALILDKSGNLAIGGFFTDDLGTFAGHFQVSKAAADRAGHAVLVENAGGDGSDALAVQTGTNTEPGGSSNFITFYDGDGTPIGSIEGDGSGGITTLSGSADFAEELPVMKGEDAPEPASLVGVSGGTVTLDTEGADRVMITSTAPIMTGNATTETAADDDRRVAVAFVGQVPAKVRGPAEVGDLVVPSGKNDGTALAVAPDEYRRSTHGPIAAQAWSSKTSEDVGEITVAVGLGRSGAVAERLSSQRQRIDRLEERLTALENRPSSVPGAGGHARGAGLPGSWLSGGVLLLLLLGGSLATLLQRTGQ